MTKSYLLAVAAFAFAAAATIASPAMSEDKPDAAKGGWVVLFDGKTLDSWTQIGDANWRLADGIAVADKGNGYLVSKQEYGDFHLKAEFWVDEEANSGIYFRCTDPAKINNSNAYEANIWDTRPDPSYGTGALTGFVKVSPMPKAGGKWNTYEIIARGSKITLILNGTTTVKDADESKFARGRIALQHGPGRKDDKGVVNDTGVIKFRKVEIKPL